MFCPNCGNELPDDAKFCGGCGTKIETESSQASAQANVEIAADVTLEVTEVAEENTGPGTAFLNGLETASDHVEESPSTGNELLDKLNAFKSLFYAYMNNCRILIQWSEREQALKGMGHQWYYDNIDDPVINASKQIDSELASAKKSLETAESNIRANTQERKKAEEQYDVVRALAQNSTDTVVKKDRLGVKVAIVYAALGVILCIFMIPAMIQNPSMVGNTLEWLFFYVVIAVAAVWLYKRNKAKAQKAENTTVSSAQASFNAKYEQIEARDKQLTAEIRSLRENIKQLVPTAGEIKHDAIERAKYYYESDLLALQEGMLDTATICQTEYNQMKDAKILTSETDWYQIDDIVRYVESGRADSLKEALQLLDTSNYRESNLDLQKQIVEGIKVSTMVQAQGFAQQMQAQQATLSALKAEFEQLSAQSSLQHAENIALKAEQISKQSQMINEQSKQTDMLNNISANSNKQGDFNQEVRDRLNWTDENRPTAQDSLRDRFNAPIFGKGKK